MSLMKGILFGIKVTVPLILDRSAAAISTLLTEDGSVSSISLSSDPSRIWTRLAH